MIANYMRIIMISGQKIPIISAIYPLIYIPYVIDIIRESHLHLVRKKKHAISQISPAPNTFHKHNVLARRYFCG